MVLKKGTLRIPFFNGFMKHISYTFPRSGFKLYALCSILYAFILKVPLTGFAFS